MGSVARNEVKGRKAVLKVDALDSAGRVRAKAGTRCVILSFWVDTYGKVSIYPEGKHYPIHGYLHANLDLCPLESA